MNNLEDKLKYSFKEDSIIERAFTHSSYINESGDDGIQSYERLEFLGDAVLELAISDILYKRFPQVKEGQLTKMRSNLVCENSLYTIANNLALGGYIKFSKGERKSGGAKTKSILADVVESLIAVIYLEESFDKAKEVVEHLFEEELKKISDKDSNDDYKSLLQIWAQSQKMDLPEYKVLEEKGPDHDKMFKSAVYIDGKELAFGIAKSKRASQQEAARIAYKTLTE